MRILKQNKRREEAPQKELRLVWSAKIKKKYCIHNSSYRITDIWTMRQVGDEVEWSQVILSSSFVAHILLLHDL